jgi:uncharacterized protein (DUF3084 family)
MADQATLIARKHEVRRELGRAQGELARLHAQPDPPVKRLRTLEEQIERLMAEESSLRQAIDRTR